jgi:hypothetical protein
MGGRSRKFSSKFFAQGGEGRANSYSTVEKVVLSQNVKEIGIVLEFWR